VKTVFVSKVQMGGRICLGAEVMKILDIREGDLAQLVSNGTQIKIQKVTPNAIEC